MWPILLRQCTRNEDLFHSSKRRWVDPNDYRRFRRSVWAPVGQCGRGGWAAPLVYFRDLVELGVEKQDEQAALYIV
jgi:hypothetical protein